MVKAGIQIEIENGAIDAAKKDHIRFAATEAGFVTVDENGNVAMIGGTDEERVAEIAGEVASGEVSNAISSLSKSDVGLGAVDNTSDANKPISDATSIALASKADLEAMVSALAMKVDAIDAVLKAQLDTPLNPPALDASGVLNAIVSVRIGDKATIDAIVLNLGEIAIVTYSTQGVSDIRVGNGVTSGGVSLSAKWFSPRSIPSGAIPSWDNLIWPASGSLYRVTGGATPRTITGFSATEMEAGAFPRSFIVHNGMSVSLTLTNNSVSSDAANRLYTTTGSDIVLAMDEKAQIFKGTTGWWATKI